MSPYCSPLDGAGLRVRPTRLYTYDAVGNVLTTRDYLSSTFGRTTTQKYDYLNRLIQIVSPPAFVTTSSAPAVAQFVVNYDYDKVGNQTSVTETTTASGAPQKTTTYLYDDLNRLVQTIAPNPVTGGRQWWTGQFHHVRSCRSNADIDRSDRSINDAIESPEMGRHLWL